ncbi:BrnT family toxin [Planctomycetota bacterium]
MKFVWDENKNKENIRKHGIAFDDVTEMFDHPMLIYLDHRHDYGEDRWIGIGLLHNVVGVVVYVEWEDEETIRIISARKATQYESKEFYKRIPH